MNVFVLLCWLFVSTTMDNMSTVTLIFCYSLHNVFSLSHSFLKSYSFTTGCLSMARSRRFQITNGFRCCYTYFAQYSENTFILRPYIFLQFWKISNNFSSNIAPSPFSPLSYSEISIQQMWQPYNHSLYLNCSFSLLAPHHIINTSVLCSSVKVYSLSS